MKQSFIESVIILQDNGLLEPNYKVIWKGQFYETEELTVKNISGYGVRL